MVIINIDHILRLCEGGKTNTKKWYCLSYIKFKCFKSGDVKILKENKSIKGTGDRKERVDNVVHNYEFTM